MPVYEYVCKDCQTRFDKLTRGADGQHVTCESCASGNVRRLMSTFATVGGFDDTFVAGENMGGGGCCGGSCGCGH
ncbi:MAG: FmdB family zinc ribbon protein [Chloroflexota bacterium]|nr:MAG: zinc ribbon domain-containing protein [Chloroflexota bacterium]